MKWSPLLTDDSGLGWCECAVFKNIIQNSYSYSMKEQLQSSQDEVMLLKHTLMCLIGGSGVDWSSDDELCKLVLTLGRPT